MLEGKTALFIRTSSPARLVWYERLLELGVRLAVVEPSMSARSEFVPIFHHWIECETNDVDTVESWVRAAIAEGKMNHPDAVLSFDEYGVYPASCLAERFNCRPTPLPPAGLKATHVKSLFREWCTAHNIRSPAAVSIPEPSVDVSELVSRLNFPVVMKPSPGAGSLLAKKCETAIDAVNHAAFMWKELLSAPSRIHLEAFGPKVHIDVEEYVGGQEVDVDCVVVEGKVVFAAVSDNFEVQPPYFAEQGGLLPSTLPASQQADILELLHSFVVSHGTSLSGVLHFEAKYDFVRGAPYVIEVNCRPGSAETDVLVSTVYGVPLGEIHSKLAFRLPIDDLLPKTQTPKKYAASVNMYPNVEGIVRAMKAPTQDPNFVEFRGTPAGRWVGFPPKMFGCVAWMVADGESAEDAKKNIDRLTALVEFDIDTTHDG